MKKPRIKHPKREWMVVRVRPGQNSRAIFHMERQGCECFDPRGMVRGAHGRLSVEHLFPGYMLVRHPKGQWRFLFSTRGVLDVIMAVGGDDPAPARVPNAEVEALRAREGSDGLVQLPKQREFEPGEKVHVDKGAVSFDAIVEGASRHDRLFVLMRGLGQWARAEVDVKDVSR